MAFPFGAHSHEISPPDGGFALHPHYRAPLAIAPALLKTQAGSDEFVTEKYAEKIQAIFSQWSADLLQDVHAVKAIDQVLAQNFVAASLQPIESRKVRSGPLVEVHQNKFADQMNLARDAFVEDWHFAMKSFSNILTAEFQVVTIEAEAHPHTPIRFRVNTRVRYDLVGSGPGCYREQRTGQWEISWSANADGEFQIASWTALSETQSRATNPVFADITSLALGANPSYSSQLLHGADYWRTVLDGACGIDIYGHNGISAGDFDNDGFDDLYICQPAGLPNRLYRNRGDRTFEDVTVAAGVGVLENTACALFVDIDNDGQQDLIVVRTDGPLLFLNQGNSKFRQKPGAFQFAQPPQGTFTGAALADYDRDGWLDIYFCLYLYYQGTDQYKYPSPYFDAENGPPNFMMRNNRDGTFSDVTAQTGLSKNNTRYSFCCGWSDYNRDGWPDLYVVNDFGKKNLYRNNGDGTFTDVAAQKAVEDIGAGMSVCWFDYDNDGSEDLYVADMWTAAGNRVATQDVFQKDAPQPVRALYRKHARGNSLFRHAGADNAFQDASAAAGVEMGRWSWSSDAWDFDHDGFPDLYIANGMVSGAKGEDLNSFFWRQVVANSPNEAKPAHAYEQAWNALNELIRSDSTWSGYERNVFYANNRDGTFSDISGAIGLDFLEDGRAFALADFDHDGRLEIFLKNRNAPQLRILKNVSPDLPASLAFRLRGSKSNRDAIGAAITVETELGRQTRTIHAGSGFLSQHSKEVFFGLGSAKGPVHASILWPSGAVQKLDGLPLNHRVWVEEGDDHFRVEPFKTPTEGTAANPPLESEALPATVETWLVAPVSAPDFSLPALQGKPRSLAEFRGKQLLLHFWVSNSPACREDLAFFQSMQSRWSARGLQLLSFNADDPGDAGKIRALAREQHLTFPILLSSDDVAGIYNTLYRYLFGRHRDLPLPTSFLIDANGDILKLYQGRIRAQAIDRDLGQIPRTAADRLARALPFPGVIENAEFRRNYLSLGSAFFQREYFGPAEAFFRLAQRDDPASAEALYGLGSVYLKREKLAQARESFQRAIKLQSGYPDTLPNAWNNLGLLATREGRTGEAIPYFQEALRLSPDHFVALENLGNAYRAQQQWGKAREALERALQVDSQDPEANYSLGMVFAQTGDNARAYEYLQNALKFRPGYPEALNNLGVLYLRTGRRDDAVASFEESIRGAPQFDQSYLNLARVYILEGTPDKARAVLLDLLKQRPNHPQAQKMLGDLPQ